jgi:hypothetical protein
MPFTVRDLVYLLDSYFPLELPANEALYFIFALLVLYPLYLFHETQRHEPRQPTETGWKKAIRVILLQNGDRINSVFEDNIRVTLPEVYLPDIFRDVAWIYEFLGETGDLFPVFKFPAKILVTTYHKCILCSSNQALRRMRKPPMSIQVIEEDNLRYQTHLVVAECTNRCCRALYYPDRITFKTPSGRKQKLLCDAKYLRISKIGLWVHRKIAYMQEHCVRCLHSGSSAFADFYNSSFQANSLTLRQ